jgi:rubredoxin
MLYNSEFGDTFEGIVIDILLEDLSEDYSCSLCESPKIIFAELVINI